MPGAAGNQAASHIHRSDLIEGRDDVPVPRIARANAPKAAAAIASANKEVAAGGQVERSPLRRIGNTNRSLPGDPAIGRPAKSAEVASEKLGPKLVLAAVTHAGRSPIDREPLLVAAVRASIG